MIPGEVTGPDDMIEINAGRAVVELRVENGGDRPIQVGSHYHFAEANPALRFDRVAAHGCRLDVPAGTAVRFEPGIAMDVSLVPFGGNRRIVGLRGEVAGNLDDDLDDGNAGNVDDGNAAGLDDGNAGNLDDGNAARLDDGNTAGLDDGNDGNLDDGNDAGGPAA